MTTSLEILSSLGFSTCIEGDISSIVPDELKTANELFMNQKYSPFLWSSKGEALDSNRAMYHLLSQLERVKQTKNYQVALKNNRNGFKFHDVHNGEGGTKLAFSCGSTIYKGN